MEQVRYVDLKLSIVPPVGCTAEQIAEWVKFQIGWEKMISFDNPLIDHELKDVAHANSNLLEFELKYGY